jgi:hypothetical protein
MFGATGVSIQVSAVSGISALELSAILALRRVDDVRCEKGGMNSEVQKGCLPLSHVLPHEEGTSDF